MLHDIQAGHRRMIEDLRPPGSGRRIEDVAAEPRPSQRRAGAGTGANPLEDVDIPSWVEGSS